jgi:hypothetical protein
MSAYPFESMAVGQSVTIPYTGQPGNARYALHCFRYKCRLIGYPEDQLPNFRLTFLLGELTIERLPDGTVLPRGPRKAVVKWDERGLAIHRIAELEMRYGEEQSLRCESGDPDWDTHPVPRELQDLYLKWFPDQAYPEERVEPRHAA